MAENNDMADMYSKLAGDIDKALDECLKEKPSEEEHSLGRLTRSMTEAPGSDRNIALLVKEVMQAIQPVMVKCIVTAVTRAMEIHTKAMREEFANQGNGNEWNVLTDMQKQIKQQSYQLEKNEQFQKRENIRIKGLTYEENENTEQRVIGLARDIGVTLTSDDISERYRVGATTDTSYPKPVFVRLAKRTKKVEIMKNKKKCRRGVYIDEDLTRMRSNMMYEIRKHQHTVRTWTIDGKIFAIIKEDDAESKKIFDTPDDLYKLGWNEQKLNTFLETK